MRRFFLLFLAVVFPVFALRAAETSGAENPPNVETFPLALVLAETGYTENGAGSINEWRGSTWRPDWPLELPPDAFKVFSGAVFRVTIEGKDFSLTFRSAPGGRIEEFPFMLNGKMAQVSLTYGENTEIREMSLAFHAEKPEQSSAANEPPSVTEQGPPPVEKAAAGEETAPSPSPSIEPSTESRWKLEFLEYRDFFPVLVRASFEEGNSGEETSREKTWCFIALSRGRDEIIETWYNEEGQVLAAYGCSFIEIGKNRKIRTIRDFSAPQDVPGSEYHYDSGGFLTDVSHGGGFFKALYHRKDLPGYWERQPRGNDDGKDTAGSGQTEGLGVGDGTVKNSPPENGGTENGAAVNNGAETGAAKDGAAVNDETGIFTFQWDEKGFLVRMTGAAKDSAANSGPVVNTVQADSQRENAASGFTDNRYEYTLDERGNWIERREIRMRRAFGLLVPSPGNTVKRVLEYVKTE